VGFLRRLLGGGQSESDTSALLDEAEADAEEAAYERDLLRAEQERMSDLTRRQLRYSEYAWKPPDQGGERRADDRDEGAEAETDDG